MPDYNPRARALILRALEDQLASSETPEVKAEFERLVKSGFDQKRAKEMMGTVLSFYIVSTVQGREFDYAAYIEELRKLPDIDFDKPL